jgi:transposase
MFEALGITDVSERATQPNPAMRIVTTGQAGKARVRHGLGFLNQQLSLVPHFVPHKPLARLIAPGIQARHRNDDTLGRALDTLYAVGVTALYSLMAATAAQRLGLTSVCTHLDRTSFHVDGRYNSDEEPEEQVMPSTRGDSRDQRPDLTQVRLDLMVEHQAGMPVLMQPLHGNSSDTHDLGQIITDHMAQLQTTYGPTVLVAARALESAENLQKLAATRLKWLTRVPATLREAQAVLAQADPQTMAPLTEGYRSPVVPSSYGGIAQRGGLIHSAPRQPQAQRTVDQQWRTQSADAGKACKTLCRTACACAADAPQARARFAHDVPTTFLSDSTISPTPHDGKRGRPGPGAPPAQGVYHIASALASRLTDRQARVDQHRCCILATNALAEGPFAAQAVLAGYKGQAQAERGFRFLTDPQCVASSCYLKKPERIMALLMAMTVCLLVYAALESRIRPVLKEHAATLPDQKGQRIQHPTARWVFHYVVGMHGLYIPGQGLTMLHLTDEHQHLLQLLGKRYAWFYR